MRSRYKGIGRPKTSDYVICKIKERQDVFLADMLAGGFSTSYTN